MTKDCPAGTPSVLKPWLAAAGLWCGLIGYHLLLPPPAQETWRPAEYLLPYCSYTLPAGAPSQFGVHSEMSSLK